MTDIIERLHRIGVQQEAATIIKDLRFAALAVDKVNEQLREELADVRKDAAMLREELADVRADAARLQGYIETLKTSQSSAVVNELNDEIERLRTVLKECRPYIITTKNWDAGLIFRIDGALKP